MNSTIIIAGSGRCGTSVVMQMLHAAGVPCIGTWPDFECLDTVGLLHDDPDGFKRAVEGKAVKILDPHRYRLPDFGDATCIWLKRNPTEQAKSVLKLLHTGFSSRVENNRKSRRAITQNLRLEQRIVPRLLRKCVGRMSTIDFEMIIREPSAFAAVLCEYLGLDPEKAPLMARQVLKREPNCLPYMLEEALVGTLPA